MPSSRTLALLAALHFGLAIAVIVLAHVGYHAAAARGLTT